MKKLEHLREKAIELRNKKRMSLPEICDRLNLKKTTVYYWIKDMPLDGRTEKQKAQVAHLNKGNKRMIKKYAQLREAAYEEGLDRAKELFARSTFRDFVVVYMTEGYRKNRNTVSVANSNSSMIVLSLRWIDELRNPERKIVFRLQIHIDQDEDEVKDFWSKKLGIEPNDISTIRKSNSGNLSGRTWASKYGVMTVLVCDTYLRSKLQAWMDIIEKEWQ